MAPIFTGFRFGFGGGAISGSVRGFGTFSVSPGATPIGSTWNAVTSTEINITTGDYTLTASTPYSINAYVWGAGGSNAPINTPGMGGTGGFSYGIINGNTSDVLVLKGGFGKGTNGGNGYGIFLSSFTHANSRLIAGGGGGSGIGDAGGRSGAGGAGGGLSGDSGEAQIPTSAGGGTQVSGGAGGAGSYDVAGSAGSALQGGSGGTNSGYYGGSGGGGYYGGGGGGLEISWTGGGGGGGSGYIHPSIVSGITTTGYATAPAESEVYRGNAAQPASPGRIYLK